MIIQQRCKAILQKQDGQLSLNKLYEAYIQKYGSSFVHNSDALKLWLQSGDFLFETIEYKYCLLAKGGLYHSGGYIEDKSAELLKGHDGRYTLSVLLEKLKDNRYVASTMTESELLSYLNRYPYITIENRSFVLCKLKKYISKKIFEENTLEEKEPIPLVSKMNSPKSIKTLDSSLIRLSTPLAYLVQSGDISEKEAEHCWRKGLNSVGDVKKMIDKYQLTKDSTRFTQYTLDIWFKIFDLWGNYMKAGQPSTSQRSNKVHVTSQSLPSKKIIHRTETEEAFIKEYFAEHNQKPLWYELYHAVLFVQRNTYHASIEKCLQNINLQHSTDYGKRELLAVKNGYQLHKDFYFRDEQPLSSWWNEQLAHEISESDFLHFAALIFCFDIVELENDEVMINPKLTSGVKNIEREARKCINANTGSNSLILIDELLPIDIESEQEKGLKLFATAWLKRHYQIEVSGDSFWI